MGWHFVFTALRAGALLLHEFLHGIEQSLVTGMFFKRRLPDFLGLLLCPLYPEDLAQMSSDFRIRVHSECLPEKAKPLIEVAHAIVHPAQAIHDVGIVRRKLNRFLNELQRLLKAAA